MGNRSADPPPLPSSFRDPAGFLFRRDGVLLRHVSTSYAAHYDRLISSGLYDALVASGRLVPHAEVPADKTFGDAHRLLRPQMLPFVSYPYEWCFSQLRDAAQLTLDVLSSALERGMVLKDATAFNVQFDGAAPVFIDTLSFEEYREGTPWVAYQQFCRHFLAPLALMAYVDVRLLQLLRVHIDGLPLDLASRLLPRRTWFRFGLLTHVHMHARSQTAFADGAPAAVKHLRFSRHSFAALIDSLRSAIAGLPRPAGRSAWSDYEQTHRYAETSATHKQELTERFLTESRPETVWDLGANTGVFSRLAARVGAFTVSIDGDPAVIETSYRLSRERGPQNLLPLVMDLANPSPALGWAGAERESLAARGPADVVLALALVHHLALSNNVPLARLAEWFHSLARRLVIEFVPKEDPQAQRLLASRQDVFASYDQRSFEEAFGRLFRLDASVAIRDSARTLYLWTRRE